MKNKIYFAIFLLWNFTAIFVFAWGGLHQVDLAYNFKGFTDCNDFNCMPMNQRYSLGLNGIIIGFAMIILEIIVFSGKFIIPKSI